MTTKPTLSFEFFPPRTDAQKRRFWHTLGCLETLNPAWVSMTWGALGSDNQPSLDVLRELHTDTPLPVAAHLTCYGCTRANLIRRLTALHNLGVNHIVALRGDLPNQALQAQQNKARKQALPIDSGLNARDVDTLQHADELVALIAQASGMDISVAAYPEAHPESASVDEDLKQLKRKLDAGASRALTQFFFKADTYLRWRDRAEEWGITKPLVPGILPIHDIDKVQVFARRCGTHVPGWLVAKFDACGDSASAKHELALDLAMNLCQGLQREGVNEFHLYTLNQSNLAYALGQRLMGSVSHPVAA